MRIDWGDCDPAGIIFYPRSFDIFDAATSALFERVLGISKLELLKTFNFAGFPLVHTRARFLRPTRYGVEGTEKRVWVVRDPDGRLKSRLVPDEVLKRFRMI